MATNKELEQRIKQLEALLGQFVGRPPEEAVAPEDRADYIAWGSDKHAAFLGLVELESADEADGRIMHTSRQSGRMFCLEDEITPFVHYADPHQVARLTLRQKVSELESAVPAVPEDAPPLWVPKRLLA